MQPRPRDIAASDGVGVLEQVVDIKRRSRTLGAYVDEDGTHIGDARTPGYETDKGLGWYGVVVLAPEPAAAEPASAARPASVMRPEPASSLRADRQAA